MASPATPTPVVAPHTPPLRLLDDVTLGLQIASALRARDPEEGTRLLGKYRIDVRAESDDWVDRFDATRILDGRWVTVELATLAVCNNARARERFVDTSKAEAPLRHRSVLAVLDTGVSDEGRPFVVREAIDTEPLAQAVARGDALSWKRIRSICAQLVGVVTAARERGLQALEISLTAVRRARHSRSVDEIKLIGFAPAAELSEQDDVMAIADLVQQLAAASRELGVAIPVELDDVLARAHDGARADAITQLSQLSRAVVGIGQGATQWSRTASAAIAGAIDTAYDLVPNPTTAAEADLGAVEVGCAPADVVDDRAGGLRLDVDVQAHAEPRRRGRVLPWLLLVAVTAGAVATQVLAPETWPRVAEVARRGLHEVADAVRGLSPEDVAASPSLPVASVAPVVHEPRADEVVAAPVVAPPTAAVMVPTPIAAVVATPTEPSPRATKRGASKRGRSKVSDAPAAARAVVEETPADAAAALEEAPLEATPAAAITRAPTDIPLAVEPVEAASAHDSDEGTAALEPVVVPEAAPVEP